MNDSVRSAARVLDLLELLARAEDGLSLVQASQQLAAPKSSTLMLLRTLVGRGYATRLEGDRYRMNPAFKATGFGWGGARFARLVAIAEPVMHALAGALGETVILGVLAKEGMIELVSKVVANQDVRYDIDLGKPLPAYCTAIGRVLLASTDRQDREAVLRALPLAPLTPRTLTDAAAIGHRIDEAARSGFAIVEEEFALGGTGVAVAIAGADGRTVAALNAGCISARFPAKRDQILGALKEAAATIAERLGRVDAP
jgi:DNA-binding IclR family transcriptional regulator